MDARRFFRNCLKSAITALLDAEERYLKAIDTAKETFYEQQLSDAIAKEKFCRSISQTVDTLVYWLQHDVFEKSGQPLKEREFLYDFIVAELMNIEKKQSHRISEVRILVDNQRDHIQVADQVLEKAFQQLADEKKLPIEKI